MNMSEHGVVAVYSDPDDAPELTEEFFERANEYVGERLVSECITIRLSADVLESFRTTGPGWQTKIDAALADWLETHEPSALPF